MIKGQGEAPISERKPVIIGLSAVKGGRDFRAKRRLRAFWRWGGRAVECTGLENQQGFTPFESSNLSPTAKMSRNAGLGLRRR